MKRLLRAASSIVALSLTAISLAACATDGVGTAAAVHAVAAAGPVNLPDQCEALLRQQAVVRAKVGDDYRVLFRRAQNGQIVENSIIQHTHECLEAQRKLYSGTQ